MNRIISDMQNIVIGQPIVFTSAYSLEEWHEFLCDEEIEPVPFEDYRFHYREWIFVFSRHEETKRSSLKTGLSETFPACYLLEQAFRATELEIAILPFDEL